MKTLRFGCIGCGSMGNLHCRNAKHVPGMVVVAFADADRSKAETLLANLGGEYVASDAAEILNDKSIDAVLIQTGEKWHPKLGIAAAEKGKHIFLEKPIAVTVEEAIALEDAVRKSGVKLLMGFCNRLAPMIVKAKKMLPNPIMTYAQCASYLSGHFCHHVDLLVHKFHDAPLVSVYAVGGKYFNNPYDENVPVDSVIVTLKFADDSQASYIQHGEANNALMTKYSMQLFGKDRCVYLAKRYKECHLSTNLTAPDVSWGFQGPDFSDFSGDEQFRDVRGPHGYMGHYDELVALCESIRNDTPPPMTVEEGRNVLQVEKAVFESCVTGKPVDYPEFLKRWGST